MERGIRNLSGSRNNFPYEAPLLTSPDDETAPPAAPIDAMHRSERDANDVFEESSTEHTSVADSLQKLWDPMERRLEMAPPPPMRTEKVDRHALLTDISRCQNQVEELITLFKSLSATNVELPVRENTPRLRQRFESRLPRRRGEVPARPQQNLDEAREQLSQSLDDALQLLDRFPRERQLLTRSLTPSSEAPLSHRELLDAVECLEQISLHASSDAVEEPSVSERNGIRPVRKKAESKFREVDRLPVLEESLSLSSDPCTTPSGFTNEEYWIRDQAEEMLLSRMSPSRESPFHQRNHRSTDSGLWNLFPPSQTRSQDGPQPFRIFFQDPTQFGVLALNSSQSLSGLESSYAIRVQPHLERDAVSESGVLNSSEDISPLCTRCHSATAALCPSSTAPPSTHQRQRSLAESSDWDVVDGISVRDDSRQDAVPGRLTPETIPWTSSAFSTLEFRPQSRTVDVIFPTPDLPFHTSEASDKSTTVRVKDQQKVDRSVQCDLSTTMSHRMTPRASGCGFWFKRRNKKHGSRILNRLMLSPLLQRTVSQEGSLSQDTGVFCGIRTAVRAALRPPCPTGRRDRRTSSGCLSTSLYSDENSSTSHSGRSGPSAV